MSLIVLLTLSVHAERVTVVTLSVCVSLFYFGEGAVFKVDTYISTF